MTSARLVHRILIGNPVATAPCHRCQFIPYRPTPPYPSRRISASSNASPRYRFPSVQSRLQWLRLARPPVRRPSTALNPSTPAMTTRSICRGELRQPNPLIVVVVIGSVSFSGSKPQGLSSVPLKPRPQLLTARRHDHQRSANSSRVLLRVRLRAA